MSEIIDCIAWIVRKTCWSFYIFLEFLFLRFLDFLGLIFNIAACLTIVRLPCMIRHFGEMDSLAEWRYIGLIQLLIFISDIPVMIASLLLMATVYRLYPLYEELQEEYCEWDFKTKSLDIYYAGCKPRGIILKHFFLMFFDLLFIPAGLVCICSWRCVIFIRAIKDAENSWDRRVQCFVQFGLLLLDIPCIVLGIVCLLTWRLPLIIAYIVALYRNNEYWKWDDEKWNAFKHFGLLFIDIPCIICFFISFFTWRAPFMLHKLKKLPKFGGDKEMKARKIALTQFLLLFVDIPCIIAFLFVLLTIWRFPPFVKDFRTAMQSKKKRQWKIRLASVMQLAMFFLDLGCLILSVILVLTIWRIYPLQRDIKKYIKRKHDLSKGDDTNDAEDETSKGEASFEEGPRTTGSVSGEAVVESSEPDDGASLSEGEEDFALEHKPKDQKESEIEGENEKKFHLSWKIRKSICYHFVFLLIDIPAMALLCFLIATVIRVPAVLSAFLQSGDIYLEFAVTVYYQTYLLVVDLFFLMLFIVLMILRPIRSWICLLEDEDHMKYRLLCHHMQWVPDIIARRSQVYSELDELITINLKMFSSPSSLRLLADQIMDSYINDLKRLEDKIKSADLDPDYLHLLNLVLWFENKRIDKVIRKYTCEYNYLQRPDSNIHKMNLSKLSRELLSFDSNVEEQYRELQNYKPNKVPLWTISTGLNTRSRKETQKVLINCLPRGDIFVILCAVLCCLPVYRAPMLIKRLWNQWYDRADIVLSTMKEYGLDMLTFLRILLVLVFIYRAPFLITDISIDIFEKRSWKAVRKTAKKYPLYIWEDFLNLLKTLFSWKTPRFIFTALLFGILMPADMFLTASKLCLKKLWLAYLVSGILYIIFMSFPFILSFYLGKKLLAIGQGWVAVPTACIFVGILLLILAFMVYKYVVSTSSMSMIPKMPDYIHWNWYNIHVIIMEILEFLQLLALVFVLPNVPIYGGKMLRKVSSYLLLSFISFELKFWTAFVLFVIWSFLSAAPIIFEQILEDLPAGTCEKNMGWRMLMSVFSNTLFVTMLESFASCFACSYHKCPANVAYKLLPSNASCFTAYLSDDATLQCWTGTHKLIALFGLFAFVWYTSTSFIAGVQYGDPGTKTLDVDFSPAYNTIANFIKAIMVIAVVNITISKFSVVGVLIAGNMLLILLTILFKPIFKYRPTNSLSFIAWRVSSFSSGLFAAVAVIVAFVMKKPDNKIPLIIFGAGTSVSMLVALILSVILRRKGSIDKTRSLVKKRLLSLEERLYKDEMMLESWKKQRKVWRRLTRSAREARYNDHYYKDADWMGLTAREGEPEGTEKVPEGASSVDSEERKASASNELNESRETPDVQIDDSFEGQVDNSQEAAAIQTDVPLPPSYGSLNVDVSDEEPIGNIPAKNEQEIGISPCANPTLFLERNGVNILLVLEQSIHYRAYCYSFFGQRFTWLTSVALCNWVGLDHCLTVLESCLDRSYARPTTFDLSLGPESLPTDLIEDDPRDLEAAPIHVPESRDPEVIAANSSAQRLDALRDVSSIEEHGGRWKELMDKVLPTIPVMKSWSYDDGKFEIILRRSVTGTITDIGPNGIKLARGASFTLGKVTNGFLQANKISFVSGTEPKAKKGPVQVTVSEITFIWKKGTWYLETQGKSVKYSVALDSMQEISWR